MTHTYRVEGLHCQSCVEKITVALQTIANAVEVTLDPPLANFILKQNLSLDEINVYLTSIGDYRLVPNLKKNRTQLLKNWLKRYYPLFLIMSYVIGVSLVSSFNTEGLDWAGWMNHFMAGFFLVFSAFKFLDLPGFVNAFATYDLLAPRWRFYGFFYPFLELGLGLAYLIQFYPTFTNVFTIILMGFSSIGVIKALLTKHSFQCACLGTLLNVPMSFLTLLEDLLMVIMAAMMLLIN